MKPVSKVLALLLCFVMFCSVAAPATFVMQAEAASSSSAQTIKLNKTKATVYNGKKLKLKVSGTKETVKWSSSNKKIATVKKGVVTPKKPGSVKIKAKVAGQTLVCKVTVKSPISASVSSLTLKENQAKNVKVTWILNDTIYYEVYDSSIVSCTWSKKWKNNTTTLKVKGLKPGSTVVALYNDLTDDVVEIPVTVKPNGPALTADKTTVELFLDSDKSVSIYSKEDGDITFSVANPAIVSASLDDYWGGDYMLTLTGKQKGSTTVTVNNKSTGSKLTINVTVKLNGPSIQPEKTTVSLNTGEDASIEIKSQENGALSCTVSDPSIVTASISGSYDPYLELTAKKAGTAIVTIRNATSGASATVTVDVKNNGPTITLEESSLSMQAGQSKKIDITTTNYADATCKNSDSSVVSAKVNGGKYSKYLELDALKAGSATITVTNSETDESVTLFVTVKEGVIIDMPYTPVILHEYDYQDNIKQTYTITNVSYEVGRYDEDDNNYTVYLYFGGNKTYDYRGSGQTSNAVIGWKLYDAEGYVVDSDTCYAPGVAMGDSWKAESAKDYIWDLKPGHYRLEILSVN